jgi:hypothetical protein
MMIPAHGLLHLSHRERSDRACDPGEGTWSFERPYPLTPTLSPWEREHTDRVAPVGICESAR